MRHNLYVFGLYLNPDLDDRIFDCLQASMAAMLREDISASFLFVGDLNGHHQECCVLPPQTVMELQLLTSQPSPVVISWSLPQPMRMVEHLTWVTDVLDLVQVAVVAPKGNSDYRGDDFQSSSHFPSPMFSVHFRIELYVTSL